MNNNITYDVTAISIQQQ